MVLLFLNFVNVTSLTSYNDSVMEFDVVKLFQDMRMMAQE